MTRDDAESAFALLASDIRLRILETLVDVPQQEPLSFTELYDAVDAANTSQFSYHLKELTEQYVQHQETGYVVTDAGRRIVQSIKADEYTLQPKFDPVAIETHCPYCGATAAEATYDGRLATIDCLSCANTVLRYELRPGHVAKRSSLRALEAADRQMRGELCSAVDGVCQRCGGSMKLEFITGKEVDPATVLVVCECQHCMTTLSVPIEVALLHHPEVIAKFWDDNLNVTTTPTWELLSEISDWDVELDASDGIMVEFSGNKHLRFELEREEETQLW
ncbi:helix-turn-helix domain-containing protein [Haloferax sp. MBLA0076]|uniref:Helix-turn-helix domain-containing protein n=1 Tax=Haloferax litoreum TaxID=2666140 RepID=A0A6A8GNH3_9EURY|nr:MULTISPECIES: winged helix-turn-helix domain-containing protein [Haloferax]KAB1190464.1 winged helix-turn-helix transcriptional regulator [Haloferax sp. CBA1148]MRX23440.1 helix-turn-helix domain-containing protein [Haloferax litoreum]